LPFKEKEKEGEVDPKLGGQWKEKEKVLLLDGQWKEKVLFLPIPTFPPSNFT